MVKRHMLSKKDVRRLLTDVPWLREVYGDVEAVEVIEVNDSLTVYSVGDEPALAKSMINLGGVSIEATYPTLLSSNKYEAIKRHYPMVHVDEGAVKPIATGADVMRPGIVKVDGEFKRGDVVLVVSPSGKVIAIAVSLYDSGELVKMTRGKVLINIHHVGDALWKLMSDKGS